MSQQTIQEKIAMTGWGTTLPKPKTQIIVAQAKVKNAPVSEDSTPSISRALTPKVVCRAQGCSLGSSGISSTSK